MTDFEKKIKTKLIEDEICGEISPIRYGGIYSAYQP